MENEYQLCLSFFDVVHKKFIGKTYSSKFYKQIDQEVILNMVEFTLFDFVSDLLFKK